MQQIKIANMNANEPAMTIISPMNAGMLVLVVIGNKYLYLYLFCVSYINRFLVSIFWGGRCPPPGPPAYGTEGLSESLRHRGLTGAQPHIKKC